MKRNLWHDWSLFISMTPKKNKGKQISLYSLIFLSVFLLLSAINAAPSHALPNLTPYKPDGWSNKIVVSKTTGTNADSSPLYTTDTLYVDWAVLNNSTIAATFYTKLYVDGEEKGSWYSDSLSYPYYAFISDYSIGSLSAGTHTIKIVADATEAIVESNELDNEYTKTITVSQPYDLTVTKSGTGTGSVTANSGVINWNGNTGTATYASGTSVILTAAAGTNSTFTGWSGDCSGTGSCQVTMNADKSVTAEFRQIPIAEALDNPSLIFTTGGNSNWAVEKTVYYSGTSAVQSGAIGSSQSTWLETTIQGPVQISFYWKVSSELGYDYLRFAIDGVEQAKISGEVNWQQKSYLIPSGNHTLRWSYTKDAFTVAGQDRGWLDKIDVVPVIPTLTIGTPSKIITGSNPVTYTVSYENADAITLSANDATLNTTNTASGTVSVGGTGNTRTVTISGITGDGTLGISIGPGTASNAAGGLAAAAGPSATFTVDNTAPVVSAGGDKAKNGAFTQTATAQDASAMTYTWSMQSGPGTVTFGTPNALSTTISASTDGTYVMRFTATDAAGNSSFSQMTLVWDTIAPTMSIGNPSATGTNSGPVTYTVTYANADAITLSPANVTLNRTNTAGGTVSVSGTGSTSRTVTISGITGNGTLGITIGAGTASDIAGNLAPAAGPSATFLVKNTAPVVDAGVDQTKNGVFTQTATAQDVIAMTYNWSKQSGPGEITFGSPNLLSTTISANSDGTYVIRFTATEITGNSSFSDMTLVWDTAAPTVSIGNPSATSTTSDPVTYTVSYLNADTITLSAGNVTLNRTNTANGFVSVSGTGNTRIVKISGITGNGTLGITIGAGTASDIAGNLAPAAGPSATFAVNTAGEKYKFERMWPSLQQPWYFSSPRGMAMDIAGNIYIADAWNHRVLKFTSNFQLITAWGRSGVGDGEFNEPTGIAVDSSNDVFIVERGNNRVQKFTADGTYITKWGGSGSGDGQFNTPTGIVVNTDGTVYVTDTNNHRIQKFKPMENDSGGFNYVFDVKWGGPGSGNSQFNRPSGISMDREGNLYVADSYNNRVQKFTNAGQFIRTWGGYGSNDGQMKSPADIAVDGSGNVYVTDFDNNRIQKFDADGNYLAQWGSKGNGDGQFWAPLSICVGIDGNIYVDEYWNHRVQKFTPAGTFITSWQSWSQKTGMFYGPDGLAIDGQGNLYAADSKNYRIQKFSPDGRFLTSWGGYGDTDGKFKDNGTTYSPYGIAVDQQGNVFASDMGNNRIQKFKPVDDGNGNISYDFDTKWGSFGTGDGYFRNPAGIDVDGSGNVYVVDGSNSRIQKFRPVDNGSGGFNYVFDIKWGSFGSGNGQFNVHRGLAVDGGNVYVADTLNNRIQKFDASGNFIKTWGEFGAGDGQLYQPFNVAVDGDGNVYVADTYNDRIQKFTADGSFITKWGGKGTIPGLMRQPHDLAVNANGDVYVIEYFNNRIQMFKKYTVGSNNKAIIVAGGGPFPGNNLWGATQMSANFAYRTLTSQGFTKETIFYLSSNTGLDLDENGVADDIAGDATNANLQNAILNWASEASGLVVYLVDHGGDDSFRMSGSQTLSSAGLASWLNQLQAARNIPVTVIYDACESGSFVDNLKPPQGKQRIIITSTSPGEKAYFLAQGSVSFSNYFWTHIFNGVNIKTAFSLTKDAVTYTTAEQHPLVDADGDGIANEEEDFTLVQNTYIGNGTAIQGSAPAIGAVSPAQTIADTNSAPLYASGVTDADGIARVWAVIRPPDYRQGAGNPVQSLPSVDLMPVGNDRYESSYNAFTTPGTYQIAIYARDRIGNTSLPKITTVSMNNPLRRKAVLVAGGAQTDALWPATENNARHAYDALKFQGYVDDDIYFMSPVTFSSGVDVVPTLDNLSFALTQWGKTNTQDLVLYLIGNGGTGTYQINDTETLNAATLKQWLDTLQEGISGIVTVIYDAPLSGSFLPVLAPPAGKHRILLMSAGGNQTANFLSGGDISFSSYFWRGVSNGMNVRDAYLSGKQALNAMKGNQAQAPLLDDNGNGIANEKADGLVALYYAIGFGITLGADDPLIGSVSPPQTLTGTASAVIWAKDVTTTGSIAKVWAVIAPPGTGQLPDVPVTDLPTIDLLYNENQDRYEGTYNIFKTQGEYAISIYAKDQEGNMSQPSSTTVTQTTTIDPYEDDNSPAQASVIVLNDVLPQTHNFHAPGDVDWVKFYALANTIYEIKVDNVGPDADIVLELFDSDGATRIKLADDYFPGEGELITWTAPKTGIYYVRVRNYDPGVYGDRTNYDLTVYRPVAPDLGTIRGIVLSDYDLAMISSATIQASLGSALSEDGSFILRVEAGTVDVSVAAEGYRSNTVENVTVEAGQETLVTIRMVLPVPGDVDGSGKLDLTDAILALQIISRVPLSLSPSVSVPAQADVNGDGKIGMAEVIYILQKVAGLRQQ